VLILFGAAIVASLVLTKTVLGRYTFALGSNEEATRLSGVTVDTWKIAVYTLCGLFAGLAGVIMAARLNSAQPALGAGYELDAIAAAVIGGTSLSGGEGSIVGTIIAPLSSVPWLTVCVSCRCRRSGNCGHGRYPPSGCVSGYYPPPPEVNRNSRPAEVRYARPLRSPRTIIFAG